MTDRQNEAFQRLLADATSGGQAKVDALVALAQRTIWVVPWGPGIDGFRTLVNSAGMAALPVFTSLDELENACQRFGWLEPTGNSPRLEIGARRAFGYAREHQLGFVVVDITSDHSLEITRDEIEPLAVVGARRESEGPFAATGRMESSLIAAVSRAPASKSQPGMPAVSASKSQPGMPAVSAGKSQPGMPAVSASKSQPGMPAVPASKSQPGMPAVSASKSQPGMPRPMTPAAVAAVSAPPTRLPDGALPPRPEGSGLIQAVPSMPAPSSPGSIAAPSSAGTVASPAASSPGSVPAPSSPGSLAAAGSFGASSPGSISSPGSTSSPGSIGAPSSPFDARPPTPPIGVPAIQAPPPGSSLTPSAALPERRVLPTMRLFPPATPPDETLFDKLEVILRGYPEVEWACIGNASGLPAVGLRLDSRLRMRVEALAQAIVEVSGHIVVTLDDPQHFRAAKTEAIVFYPWRR